MSAISLYCYLLRASSSTNTLCKIWICQIDSFPPWNVLHITNSSTQSNDDHQKLIYILTKTIHWLGY